LIRKNALSAKVAHGKVCKVVSENNFLADQGKKFTSLKEAKIV